MNKIFDYQMKYHLPVNINSVDKSILYNDYILIYRKSDGFSRRLLKADLIVDSSNIYELKISSHEYLPTTAKPCSLFISGHLPIQIKEKIEYLLTFDSLKEKVSRTFGKFKPNCDSNDFILKQHKAITRSTIHFFDEKKFEKRANPAEKELMKIHQMLHRFIESIYELHMKI